MSIDVERTWRQKILPKFSVPPLLHPWQTDTISLLLNGDSVALCVPTGGGKTLPQLAASLFFDGGVGLVIPPLLSIEHQMESTCKKWRIPVCNISRITPGEIIPTLESSQARIILSSIETISDEKVQKAIQNVKVNFIAVDECQVMDDENGWTTFRPYVPLTWAFLRANFRAPFLLCSATMEEDSLLRIAGSICMDRAELKTIFKNPDRPNIYQQRRVMQEAVDAGNIDKTLSFLLPVIADTKFSKCQIFSTNKYLNDVVAAWLKKKLHQYKISGLDSGLVEKLSGDNSKEEKERVMDLFKSGECRILISTDVAGMGTDVADLSLVVNLGIPKTPWKFLQQCGRAGREGQPSLAVTIKFPQKGRSAPQADLKKAICGEGCLRSEINKIFTLANTYRDYSEDDQKLECLQLGCELSEVCDCTLCSCCSCCSTKCSCPFAVTDHDKVLEGILGLGDEKYRAIQSQCKDDEISDDEGTRSSGEDEDEEDEPRRDDLEISFIDLTPQFASLSSNI